MGETARNFVNDKENNTWARISNTGLYNLTTNETLDLELGDGGIGNFIFNPASEEILIWHSSSMSLYENGNITATFDNDVAPFSGESFRRFVYSENGTVWLEVSDGAIYVLQSGAWELVHDFPAQTYVQLFQAGRGSSIRITTYSQVISFYDVHPTGLTELDLGSISITGFNGAYAGESYDVTWVHDLETNTVQRYNGTEFDQVISFPSEWNTSGFIRNFSEVDGKILIADHHEIALYDGVEWFRYDVNNSPLDTERIDRVLLDKEGTAWVFHSFPNVIEKLTTSLISSTENALLTRVTPLLAYPNPTNEIIRFTADNGSRFTVFSMTGQVINNGLVTDNITNVSLVGIPAGNYVLRVVQPNGSVQVAKVSKL